MDLRGVEKSAEIEHQKSICRYSVFKKGGEEHRGDSGTPWYPTVLQQRVVAEITIRAQYDSRHDFT